MQLEKLALSNNKIKNIDILANTQFKLLRELKLSNNNLSNISILSKVKFPKLKSLILSNNNIIDIDCLQNVNFPILFELKLSNNRIKNIDVFKKIRFKYSLKRLYLSHNFISDIWPLIDEDIYCDHDKCNCIIISLKELNLAGNLIDQKQNKKIINDMKLFIKHFII